MIESGFGGSMSKRNGEKARAAIEKRRRTAQRAKDRSRRAEIKTAAPQNKKADK
jgi:hypothetical protein